MFKKITALLLVICIAAGITSCAGRENEDETGTYIENGQVVSEGDGQSSAQASTVKVTIPEGYTLVRISWLIEEKGFCTSEEFIEAAQTYTQWLDLSQYSFLSDLQNAENVCFYLDQGREPEWMLEFRLKAFRHWLTMKQPEWGHLKMPEIDYQGISYYADPTKGKKDGPKNLDEIDPELMKTFDKLGIPLEERLALSGTAVDAVMDSVSVKTTFKEKLSERGIIFCSISEAVREYPDLVKQYLGSVVPYRDNFFAALNSAVFSDGSFVYIPKGVRCPMELSTYFRINARNTGQFERTLIVCDDGGYVSYLAIW